MTFAILGLSALLSTAVAQVDTGAPVDPSVGVETPAPVPADEGATDAVAADAAVPPAADGVSVVDPLDYAQRLRDQAARRRAAEAERQRNLDQRLLMALAGLLVLLLVQRLLTAPKRKAASAGAPHRRVAMTRAELGTLVVEVVHSQDLHDFRGLFLNGPEAARVFGEDGARRYLEQRSEAVLRAGLQRLGHQLAPGERLAGVADDAGATLVLRLELEGLVRELEVGRVAEVPGGVRLVEVAAD